MQADDLNLGDLYTAWIEHEAGQYGMKPRAVLVVRNDDPHARFLVAGKSGIIELNGERTGPRSDSAYTLTGKLHRWKDLSLVVETRTATPDRRSADGDWWSHLHLIIKELDIDVAGPSMHVPDGLEDFTRECVKAIAKA